MSLLSEFLRKDYDLNFSSPYGVGILLLRLSDDKDDVGFFLSCKTVDLEA